MATSIGSSSANAGLDVGAIVSQLISVERQPEQIWQNQKSLLEQQASELQSLSSQVSSLQTNMDSLKDVLGVFSQRTAVSSDASVFSASATSSAVAGQHTVEVTSLASRASWYSDAQASGSTVLASGSFMLKAGSADAVAISVGAGHDTLDGLATHINGLNLGVHATVITDANGARLTVAGTSTGKASDVVISNVAGLTFTQSSQADNAKVKIDGVPVESKTNVVDGVIAGITLTLNASAPGRALILTVAPDTARVTSAVQSFVSNFNTIVKSVNAQFSYDPVAGSSGLLAGDSTVRGLQQDILSQISFLSETSGDIRTLASLGVTMDNDGVLTLDSTRLSNALSSNFDNVRRFFQGTSADGFANQFAAVLDNLTDSTEGALTVDLKGNNDTQTMLTKQIDDFEVYIASREQQLLAQYTRVDTMLRSFSATQNQITAALNSLTSNK